MGTETIVAIIAAGAAIGTTVYSANQANKQQKRALNAQREAEARAKKEAEEQRKRELREYEAQAGEYLEMTKKQIELQTGRDTIQGLLAYAEKNKKPTQNDIYYLQPAENPSPVEQLNRAIDRLLKGGE